MLLRTRDLQLQFEIPRVGGKRKGAGRKKLRKGAANHVKRPRITKHTPMHITMKLAKGLGGLRSLGGIFNYSRAADRARELGLRIVHFSLQSNHLHMIAEADDNAHLESGMRSLTRSLVAGIQRWTDKTGASFVGRYHMRRLDSPREVKNAVHYVLYNHDHHCGTENTIDHYSSNASVSRNPPAWLFLIDIVLTSPRSWLLCTHGSA